MLSSAQEAQLQQLVGAQSTSPRLAQRARVICRSALRKRTERRELSTQTKAHLLGVQAVRRDAQGLTAHVILATINKRLPNVDGAFIITILPPAIIGIGNAGGFKMLKDKKDLVPADLEAAAQELAAVANADLRLSGVFTPFTSTKLDARREIEPRRGAVAARHSAETTAEDQAGPVWRSDRAAR